MSKRVQVYLRGIYCEQVGSDPGSALEIYGNLKANTPTQEHLLWSRPDGDAVDIFDNSEYQINANHDIFLEPGQTLYLGGDLWDDDDFSGDDYMGVTDTLAWTEVNYDEIGF